MLPKDDRNDKDDYLSSPIGTVEPGWISKQFIPAVQLHLVEKFSPGIHFFVADSLNEAEFLLGHIEDILPDNAQTVVLSHHDPVLCWERLTSFGQPSNIWSTYRATGIRYVIVRNGYLLPPWFIQERFHDIHAFASGCNVSLVFCFARSVQEVLTQFHSKRLPLIEIPPFNVELRRAKNLIRDSIRDSIDISRDDAAGLVEGCLEIIMEDRPRSRAEIEHWISSYRKECGVSEPDRKVDGQIFFERMNSQRPRGMRLDDCYFPHSNKELRELFERIRTKTYSLSEGFNRMFPDLSFYDEWSWQDRPDPFAEGTPRQWLERLIAQLYCSFHDVGKRAFAFSLNSNACRTERKRGFPITGMRFPY